MELNLLRERDQLATEGVSRSLRIEIPQNTRATTDCECSLSKSKSESRLSRRCVGSHGEFLLSEVAIAVLATPLMTDDFVTDRGRNTQVHPRCLRAPHRAAASAARVEVGQLLALGPRYIEDVHDTEAAYLLNALLFAIVVLDPRLVLAGGEDGYALLLCGLSLSTRIQSGAVQRFRGRMAAKRRLVRRIR